MNAFCAKNVQNTLVPNLREFPGGVVLARKNDINIPKKFFSFRRMAVFFQQRRLKSAFQMSEKEVLRA